MEISPSQQYPTYPMSESHCAVSLSQHQVRYWEAMDSRKLLLEFLCTCDFEDPERKANEWARRWVHKCRNTVHLCRESLGVRRLYRSSQSSSVANGDLEEGSEKSCRGGSVLNWVKAASTKDWTIKDETAENWKTSRHKQMQRVATRVMEMGIARAPLQEVGY